MQAYAHEFIIGKSGVLTLKNLPFNDGEKVEVIIIPRSEVQRNTTRYPFWGKPVTYIDPTGAEEDCGIRGLTPICAMT